MPVENSGKANAIDFLPELDLGSYESNDRSSRFCTSKSLKEYFKIYKSIEYSND